VRRLSTFVLACLCVPAGVCSLVYETVWIQQFSFAFGSTVSAVSLVVAIFLAGLALGSQGFGKISARLRHPLRLLAVLQVMTGLYALAFPYILQVMDTCYSGLYLSAAWSPFLRLAFRGLLTGLVILPPTIMMGGTIPLMIRQGVNRLDNLGRLAGLFNGLNTLGAAVGSFLAGYLLLKICGIRHTGLYAGLLHILSGCVVGLLALRLGASSEEADGGKRQQAGINPLFQASRGVATLAMVSFALSGFTCVACEMLWLRNFTFYFHDTIYLYSGIIGVVIVGLGVGNLAGGLLFRRATWLAARLGFVQWTVGITVCLSFVVSVPWWQEISRAGVEDISQVVMFLFALLFVPSFCMGLAFPLAVRIATPTIQMASCRAGQLCALNTLGSMIGSLLTVFLLIPNIGMEKTLLLLVALNLMMGVLLIRAEKKLPFRAWASWLPVAAAIALLCGVRLSAHIALPGTLLRAMLPEGCELVDVREGLTGTSWITRSENTHYALWSDGLEISKTWHESFYEQGFIPMLIAPRIPERVLSLASGGALSTTGVRLFREMRELVCVDICRENMALARAHFPQNAGLSDDPRVSFVVDDARSYLRSHASSYDLILVEATPPMYSFRNAFLFTRDFYAAAARRLASAGMFVQVIPLGHLSDPETRSVMRTFASVFPHCALWFNGGMDCVMIGQFKPLVFNFRETTERVNRPEIRRALEACSHTGQYMAAGNLFSGFLLDTPEFEQVAAGGEIYTDDRSGLMFSTGLNLAPANIRRIHENLSSWDEISRHFADPEDMTANDGALSFGTHINERRQFFVANMYGAAYIYPAMLNFIQHYALNKVLEINKLRAYLMANHRTAELEDLYQRVKSSELFQTPDGSAQGKGRGRE